MAKNTKNGPARPKAEVKITAAKGRPMLSWVGKRPLSHVTAFPAKHVESYAPPAGFRRGGPEGGAAARWGGGPMSGRKEPAKVPTEARVLDYALRRILLVRGHRVMLDSDLAELYDVPTGRLNEQVKRNLVRFPSDFMFELSAEEVVALRSQFAISKPGWGGRRYAPRVFTEHGVAMLSIVLNSERAVQVNIAIIRAFVRLREMLASHEGLSRRLAELEQKYDAQFRVVFDAIRQLMAPSTGEGRRIGFSAKEEK